MQFLSQSDKNSISSGSAVANAVFFCKAEKNSISIALKGNANATV